MQNVEVTPSDWRPFFYELVMFLIGKSDEPDEWPSVLALFSLSHQAVSNEGKAALASIIVDTIWVIDLQFDGPDDKPARSSLAKVLSHVLGEKLVPSAMAKERLDPELLEAAEAIQSAAFFSKKQIRMNTSMLYKQQKFNLLREEPEGFSKLSLLLLHADPKASSAKELFDQILSLIGYFDLDPTRVLDLVLDVFAFSLHKEALFSDLLGCLAFPSGTIASILSFKLGFLADRKDPRAFDGIMAVISVLLEQRLVEMDQIYSNLTPSDAEFEKEVSMRSKKLMTASRQVGFSAASASAPSDAPVALPTLGYAEPGLEIAEHQSLVNQKAALLAALISRGATDRAKWLLKRLPELVAVSVAVQRAICTHLHRLLDTTMKLSEEAKEWLGYLGIGLHTDPVLFARLCRLLCSSDEVQVEFYLRSQLLPSFSLCAANPAMSHELWQALLRLPYSRRFELYHEWRESTYSSCPELMLARSLAMHDTRRVMRRLAKENVKQLGRLIGKMTHCSPIVVFPVILDQLQSYDNLIQPVVESLKYATSLSFDILTYTLLEALVSPEKDRLKSDGTSLAGWLQNLAVFSGALYKRYSHADLTPLLRYIVAQLLEDNTLDLVLLSELLQKMAGLESHENIAEHEMLSTAGGPLLQQQSSKATTAAHQLKRPSQRLMTALVSADLAVPLWILLAKFAVSAIHRTASVEHLKLLGLLTDQCHDVFLQYTEFMSRCQDDSVVLPGWKGLCALGVEPDYGAWMRRAWEHAHSPESNLIRLLSIGDDAEEDRASPVSPLLRRAFWGLELGDLWVPEAQYEAELGRIRALISATEPPALLTDATQRTRWLKEKEQAPRLLADLERELEGRRANRGTVRDWFTTNKTALFGPTSTRTEIIEGLIRSCILPRAFFSPTDALFTSALLHTLHDTGAAAFSSLSAFDRLIEQVAGLIFTLTEREAHCYGRFLGALLGQLRNWHSAKEVYEGEAVGMDKPGFYQRWAQPPKPNLTEDNPGTIPEELQVAMQANEGIDSMGMPEENVVKMGSAENTQESTTIMTNAHLSYEDYRHVLYKWHLKLHKAFVGALETGDYTHIRNAIIILSHLAGSTPKAIQFPVLRKVGVSLEKAVRRVQAAEEGKREDLKLLAARCVAMLQAVKAHWVPEDQFHHVPPKPSITSNADDETGSQKRSHPDDEEASLPSKVKKLRIDESKDKDRQLSEKHAEKRLSKTEEAELALRKKLEERHAAMQRRIIEEPSQRPTVERPRERSRDQERGRESPRELSRPESRSSGRCNDRQGSDRRESGRDARDQRDAPRDHRGEQPRDQRDRRSSNYSSSRRR